jgi:hypothetical protein
VVGGCISNHLAQPPTGLVPQVMQLVRTQSAKLQPYDVEPMLKGRFASCYESGQYCCRVNAVIHARGAWNRGQQAVVFVAIAALSCRIGY